MPHTTHREVARNHDGSFSREEFDRLMGMTPDELALEFGRATRTSDSEDDYATINRVVGWTTTTEDFLRHLICKNEKIRDAVDGDMYEAFSIILNVLEAAFLQTPCLSAIAAFILKRGLKTFCSSEWANKATSFSI